MPGTVVSPAGVALITQPLRSRGGGERTGGGGALETWLSSVCEEFRLGPKIIGTRAADTDGVLYTHKLLAKPCTLWGGNWDTAQRVAAS